MPTALTLARTHLPAPVGDLESYIRAVGTLPVLDAEEERRLGRRYRDENDLDAARGLVLHNLRFVVHVARGYAGYGLALGDLIQEGNIGLMKAARRFDPEMNVRLVSFAVHWIRAEIHEFILRNWRIVKVATTKSQRKLFFNLRSAKKRLGWLTRAEAEQVAADLGVTTEQVLEMEGRLSGGDISFDPIPEDDDSPAFGPAASLATEHGDPATILEAEDWEEHHGTRLVDALGSLDPRSRDIVERRWLADGKATLHELAAEYGVSAERVRQIESNALNRMRASIAA